MRPALNPARGTPICSKHAPSPGSLAPGDRRRVTAARGRRTAGGQRDGDGGRRSALLALAIVALISAGASLALTVAGARAGDGRAVLLGTAFSTITALFAVHGMATPGILVGPNGVIAAAGGLSMPVGAVLLSLTALPALRRPRRVRPLLALQAGMALAVLALGVFGLLDASAVPAVPAPASAPAYALLIAGEL